MVQRYWAYFDDLLLRLVTLVMDAVATTFTFRS